MLYLNDNYDLNDNETTLTTIQKETKLVKGLSDEILDGTEKYNESDLIKAVKSNNFTIVKEAINYGVDINTIDENGNPVIFYANKEILDFFLQKGVDINIKGWNSWTLLMLSAVDLDLDKVEFLLTKGANKYQKDNNGFTALKHLIIGSNIKKDNNKLPEINKILKLLSNP